jgi:hypothetical protein
VPAGVNPMESGASRSVFLRFSTQSLPISERVPYWREVFARQICHIEIEPQSDCPLEANATMLGMPGLNAVVSFGVARMLEADVGRIQRFRASDACRRWVDPGPAWS